MMGRKRKTPVPNAFDIYTEACPKMTRRWRREVLPEIAAWLCVHAARVEKQLSAATHAAKESGADGLKEACTRLRMRLDIVWDLVRQLPDKWGEAVYWECAKLVAERMGDPQTRPVHVPAIPGMGTPTIEPPPVTDGTSGTGGA